MERNTPRRDNEEQQFVHPDPAMDAALNWLFTLQASPDDANLRARLDDWLRLDPAHSRAFELAAGAWEFPEMDKVANEIAARSEHVIAFREAVAPRHPGARRGLWPRIAMAAAATVLLAIGIQQYPAVILRWRADYATPTGQHEEVSLPDGSRMILNTASAVSVNFQGARRSVTLLKGEAYFDVVHDAARPFTVAGSFSEVEVKGTAFSVRTDNAEDTVVLERGHIDVSLLQDRKDVASLEQGESITASSNNLSVVRKSDTSTYLAWLQGRLVFTDQPFGQVLDEVERYYGHSILVANTRLSSIRVNGSYRLDNPERVIHSLATAAGATVTRLPGGIIILR
ncbi:FecR family protein [Rhizobium sp. PDO1-076]|uniref:FecR family protein n=1 Tax=Rhizobium sp. PDO1-076 TaxID=1125979 RepID=UPI000565E3DE|nr:FecR domain-containing protein [Rhizobium sp. PDO1-076]